MEYFNVKYKFLTVYQLDSIKIKQAIKNVKNHFNIRDLFKEYFK